MPTASASLLDHRLVVVTGKGGVGKTTVACLLAEAARRAGRRVLLAETATTESLARQFEPEPAALGYAGRELRPGLHALRIDPHEALADYVRLQTRLGIVTDRILQSEIFQQLLEAAPGWRELIVLGKVWHLEQKKDSRGRPLYDLIVVDAPATGHGLTFLDVPRVVQGAIRSGPLARHAGWVEAMVHDRARTLLLPVTLAEELPVRETIELVERARNEIDIGVDRIVVNRVPRTPTTGLDETLAALPSERPSTRTALPDTLDLRRVLSHAIERGTRIERERRRVAAACKLPIVDLPERGDGLAADSDWDRGTEAIFANPVWPDDTALGEDAA